MALQIKPGCYLPLSTGLLHLVYKRFFPPQLGRVNDVLAGPTIGLTQVAGGRSGLVHPQGACLGKDSITPKPISSLRDARH